MVSFKLVHKIQYYYETYPIFVSVLLFVWCRQQESHFKKDSKVCRSTHSHTLWYNRLNNTTESLNVESLTQPAHFYVFTTPSLFCGNVCFLAWAVTPLCQTVICRCHSPSDHVYMVFRERQGEDANAPRQMDKHRKSPQHDTSIYNALLEFSWINNIPTCSIVICGPVTSPN